MPFNKPKTGRTLAAEILAGGYDEKDDVAPAGKKLAPIDIKAEKSSPALTPKSGGTLASEILRGDFASPDNSNENLARQPISPESMAQQVEQSSSFLGTVQAAMEGIQGGMSYVGKSAISGATMGIFPNNDETDSTALKVAGVVANGIATIASGFLLPEVALFGKAAKVAGAASKMLKVEKTLAPFFKGGTEAVVSKIGSQATKQAAVKSAAVVGNAVATGGIYSGAVGGIKSIRAGESQEDTLTNILVDTAIGMAGGAVLGGVIEGASSMIGNRVTGKLTQDIKSSFSKPGIADLTEIQTALANKDAKAYIAANTGKFNKKIKDVNPVLAPWEMAARPELLHKDINEALKPLVDKIFLDPKGAGSVLYTQNESLQKLVNNGDNAAAISVYGSNLRSQIKGNSYLRDYIKEPWMMDSKVLPDLMADALLSKKSYQGLTAERSKLVNYFSDPKSQSNIDELMLIKKPRGKTPTFKTKTGAKALADSIDGNMRLGIEDVENLVSSRLTELYKTVADGKITAENSLLLQDYDSVLKSMITFNKPLTRTVAESFVRGQTLDDVVGTLAKEDMESVKFLVDKRIDQLDLTRLSKQRNTLLSDLKMAQTQDLKAGVNKELENNLRKIYRVQSKIDAASTRLSKMTTDPKELERLNGLADTVYIPSIENISKKISSEVAQKVAPDAIKDPSSRQIKDRIFNRDNPKFIKDMTDLSDILQAMDHAGYDVDLTKGGVMNATSHVQRKFMKEFGFNSVFQTAIFDSIKKVNVEKQNFENEILKRVHTSLPEFKPGSVVSKNLSAYIEGKLSVTDEAFTKLGAKDKEAILRAAKEIPAIYDDLFNKVNAVLKSNNETLVQKRENYFPFYTDPISTFGQKLALKLRGETDAAAYKGMAEEYPKYSPKRVTASFQKRRTGLSEAKGNVRLDDYEGFVRYVKDASRIIHTTDLAKAVNAAADFAPSGMAKTLRSINEKYILEVPDESMRSGLGKVFGEVRRRMANSLLLGTASVAAQQLLSTPTSAAIGGKEALAAFWKRFTPEMKAALLKSTNRALRDPKSEGYPLARAFIRPLMRKYGGTVGQGAAKAFDTYEGFAGSLLKVFDKEAASHAFTTGYLKATKLGLQGDDAVRYADYTAGILQGEMTKIGQPEFMGSVYGRTLSQFMSYSMNLFSTLKDDLPMIAKSDGGIRAVQMIARSYVGMALTNEVLRDNGLPEQFDMGGFFPFHDGNRAMIPGAYGVMANALYTGANAAKGELKDNKKPGPLNWTGKKGSGGSSSMSLKKFESDVINMLGVPGIGQAQKTIRAFESKDFKKVKGGKRINAAIFGKKAMKGQSSKDSQKEFKKNPFRKEVKNIIFR